MVYEKIKKAEEESYISLQEATRYCIYSQEYLSLRARQGKLKAVKNGRNWTTTMQWLLDYLKRVEDYKNNLVDENKENQAETNIDVESVYEPTRVSEISESAYAGAVPANIGIPAEDMEKSELYIDMGVKKVPPPENLPVERLEYAVSYKRPASAKTYFQFGFIFAIAAILLTAVMFSQKEQFKKITFDIFRYTYIIGKAEGSAIKPVAENFKDYFKWLGGEINNTSFHLNLQ